MLIEMQDDTNISLMHDPVHAWAGYVGGLFPTEHPLFLKYPNVPHKSVAVNDQEDADILDIENGDATPAQFPVWFRRQKARGVDRPGAYANKSTMPAVMAAARAAGISASEYDRWVASFDDRAALDTGLSEKAKQYTDRGYGRSLDLSVCDPSFFGQASPPVKNVPHYDWFPNGFWLLNRLRVSERQTVVLYDKLRARQTPRFHPNVAELAVCRLHLKWLAGRVYRVAHDQPANGNPSWGVDHRGWRFQQLIHRAQGARLV